MTSVLRIERLSKTFPGTRALKDVSFEVAAGQIHALVGGNGSGKSTLIKILAGVLQGDTGGTIEMVGRSTPADATSPTLARECGLRFVHQNPGLFPTLTVADNVALTSAFPTRAGKIRTEVLYERTRRLLERFELSIRPDELLGALRPADQTMVAIARALEEDEEMVPTVLVLDEPTASLPDHEVKVLLDALRRCRGAGQTILYVSHRLGEVMEIADTATVLRDGSHVITQPTAALTESELVEHIVGRPLERVFAVDHTHGVGKVALEVEDLAGGPLGGVSFTVNEGEIVGIAGLLGSGRTELLRMIFGALERDRGTIRIHGEVQQLASPATAMACGVAYVPENRELDAAFPQLSVCDNLSAAQISRYRTVGGMDYRRERADARSSIAEFSVQASSEAQVFSSLSGGNQQKVVIARWLRREPKVLLLDEPTQGVDVGARADVYASIRRSVSRGMAVVLVSSDFDELVNAADRVMVLRGGLIAAELSSAELDSDTLTHLAYTTKPEASQI